MSNRHGNFILNDFIKYFYKQIISIEICQKLYSLTTDSELLIPLWLVAAWKPYFLSPKKIKNEIQYCQKKILYNKVSKYLYLLTIIYRKFRYIFSKIRKS
jgi:hypothetical protein